MSKDKKFVIRCRGIIIYEDKMLVVKHPNGRHFYALPGGHLEWGEEVKECLSRELVEELGVKPEIGRLLYINNFTEENKQSIEFIFEITNGHDYLHTKDLVRTHAHEIAEIRWVSHNESISILPEKIDRDFKEGKILLDIVRYIKD